MSPIYRHIVVATDGSDLSREAVHHAVALAAATGAGLTAVTATLPWDSVLLGEVATQMSEAEYDARAGRAAEKRLAVARAAMAAKGVKGETVHVVERHPHRAIIDVATAKGADLIVMASHGWLGLSSLLIGSETQKVLTSTRTPVLVFR
jgi:nucleotide-binding universal stress UspA family protein